tara:strand:- start:2858 stop:3247 length:390 start_codon:yes stop_codon:yes gene_type:complete
MFKSISNIFLICKDLEKSRKFYSDILELKEKKRERDFIKYEIGENCLVIHAPIKDETMEEWNLKPVNKDRGSGVILTLVPENLENTYQKILKNKGKILFPPKDVSWGYRIFMIEDPNGFIIEISEKLTQ